MFDGDWIIGCPVPLEEARTGREKLLRMSILAIEECISNCDDLVTREVPLLLCLAEEDREGKFDGLDSSVLREIEERTGLRFHPNSDVIAEGRIGGVKAVEKAAELLERDHSYCLVAGVDTWFSSPMLTAAYGQRRLLTNENSDGFIPGEAACAIALTASQAGSTVIHGVGYGHEPAPHDSGDPSRADGMVRAIRAAFADAGFGYERLQYRVADLSGGQYGFRELSLALSRTLRERKVEFDIIHPADCVGEVGAATVPVALAMINTGNENGYTPGPGALCQFTSDGCGRAALVTLGVG